MIVTEHHKPKLLQTVEALGPSKMADIYPAYCERADAPLTRRSVRKKLTELAEEDRIDAVGEKRGRTYRPKERSGRAAKYDSLTLEDVGLEPQR